jgi:cell division protein ZapA (FtsZ GTPase activity inhibitor)
MARPDTRSAPDAVRRATVELGGQRLHLRTDAPEEHLARLVAEVADRLKEVERRGGRARGHRGHAVALLTALRLADELARERAAAARLKAEVRRRSRTILEKLDTIAARGDARPPIAAGDVRHRAR